MRDKSMGWLRKLLPIEPGVSLAWWAIERISALVLNWTTFWAVISGAAMTAAGYLAGYDAAELTWYGLLITLGAALATSRIRLWATQRSIASAQKRYVESHLDKSNINPMDETFTKQRVDLRDLVTPLSQSVVGKTFVKCQIVGPVNLVLYGTTTITLPNGPRGGNIESVYCGSGVPVTNAISIIDCDFRDCEFFNTTFMVYPEAYDHFTRSLVTSWITQNPYGLHKMGEAPLAITDQRDAAETNRPHESEPADSKQAAEPKPKRKPSSKRPRREQPLRQAS